MWHPFIFVLSSGVTIFGYANSLTQPNRAAHGCVPERVGTEHAHDDKAIGVVWGSELWNWVRCHHLGNAGPFIRLRTKGAVRDEIDLTPGGLGMVRCVRLEGEGAVDKQRRRDVWGQSLLPPPA